MSRQDGLPWRQGGRPPPAPAQPRQPRGSTAELAGGAGRGLAWPVGDEPVLINASTRKGWARGAAARGRSAGGSIGENDFKLKRLSCGSQKM